MQLLRAFIESAPLPERLGAWLESLTPVQLAVLEHVQSTTQLIAFVELWREVGHGPGPSTSEPSAPGPSAPCMCGRCLSPSQESLFVAITALFRTLAASLTLAQREALRERIGAIEWDVFEPRAAPPPVGQA